MKFYSIEKYDGALTFEEIKQQINENPTLHATTDRSKQVEFSLMLNDGAAVNQSFLVDRKHKNGPEIHAVTENGIEFIINEKTKKFITTRNLRSNQLAELYIECKLDCPPHIIDKCLEHEEKGYCNDSR